MTDIYRNGRLCWERLDANTYTARRDGVRYHVIRGNVAWRALCDGSQFGVFDTLKEAVKRCQSDYADHVDWILDGGA